MRGPQRRAREDTRGRLLALAWPACTPAPALQRSHFPDPPPATPRRHAGPFPRLLPAAPYHAGPQPPSSALCLTAARTGAHWQAGNNHPLDTEGSHVRQRGVLCQLSRPAAIESGLFTFPCQPSGPKRPQLARQRPARPPLRLAPVRPSTRARERSLAAGQQRSDRINWQEAPSYAVVGRLGRQPAP